MVGLFLAGKSLGANTVDDLQESTRELNEVVELNDAVFMSDVDTIAKMPSGEFAVAMMYSGDASRAAVENDKVKYFIPEEGASIWMDSFVVSRDSGDSEAANEFINFMHKPEIAAASSSFVGFATPNELALPILDKSNPELRGDEALYPDQLVRERCGSLAITPELDTAMNRSWKALHNGAGLVLSSDDAD